MDATISVDLSGFEHSIDSLADKVDPGRQGTMRDGLLASSDVYHAAMRQRFDLYSARGGDWAEHAPSTIKKRGEGAPILNESGILRESMERDARNHVLEATGDGVVEGTEDRTARFHQDGTKRMPARPILFEPERETLDQMKTPIIAGLKLTVAEAVK